MASTQQLKSRIRSVKSTRQITKAMELVSASKMRRAQDSARASSTYAQLAHELLTHLASNGVTKGHPLFEQRTVKRRLVILITSNKGLAGAYNSNAIKQYVKQLNDDKKHGIHTQTIAVGRKGAQFVARLKGAEVLGVYESLSEKPTGAEVSPMLGTIIDAFTSGEVDAIEVIYTKYVNSLTQTVTTTTLLPAGYTEVEVSDEIAQASFEPSPEQVLEHATRRLVEAQLFQALLDSVASEQSMRMVAMKNATDNANDLVDDLTLVMNKLRQADITQELAEISSGAEAVS